MPDPVKLNRIPQRLQERPQWVLWKYEERDGKLTKPPFTVSGRNASHSNPETWNSFEAVVSAYQKGGWDGIGYMLAEEDSIAGVDLDHCLTEDGELEPWAERIVSQLNSYTEISPSGSGLRVFLEGQLPPQAPRGGRKMNGQGEAGAGAVEMYCRLRYLTVTGKRIKGISGEIEPRGAEFEGLYQELFSEERVKHEQVAPRPAPSATSALSDHELLAAMFRAQNSASLIALWNGDTSAHQGDDSAADLALCNHLAWWTKGDEAWMDRLFRQSRLYREKWEREDYRLNTLGMALESLTPGDGYEPGGVGFSLEETEAVKAEKLAALEQARELVISLPDRLKADAGAAFAPEILQALNLLNNQDPAAYERARAILRTAKVGLRRLDQALRETIRQTESDVNSPTSTQHVRDFLPDCQWGDLVVPDRYWLGSDATGTMKLDDDGRPTHKPFAYAPMLITERYHDVDSGTQALQLAYWRKGSGWAAHTVDRAVALDARKVIELANLGFPVASENSADVANYLHRFEAANFGCLRQARISSHLGWQGKQGRHGFLWGRCLITPTGEITAPLELDEISAEDWRQEWIAFRGASAGDEQIADGFHARGTWEGYVRAIHPIQHFPRVLVGFYASFATVVLEILNAPNPILDWSNVTSTGKTIALRVAASPWGKPDERAADGALSTWSNTQVWLERASSVLHSLPVILDDSKHAQILQVDRMLYTVASGRGKGRGTTKGLARTKTWRTGLLSNGEMKIVDFGKSGGAHARALCVTGIPFQKEDSDTRRLVDILNAGIQAHYGHAGPRFVQWVIQNRDQWPRWVEEYTSLVDQFATKATNGAGGRMAHIAAVIDLTAFLVHSAMPELGWEYQDPLETLWAEIVSDAAEAPPEIRALRELMGWAYQQQHRFYDRSQQLGFSDDRVPHGGWAGVWDHSGEWKEIAFFPSEVRQQLKQWNYESPAVFSAWEQRGWLRTNPEKGRTRHTARVDFHDGKPHFIVVKRGAIDEIDA